MSFQSYHESIRVPDDELVARERRANRQETLVLQWFRAHPDQSFSAEEVHAAVMPSAPITSARRAITNLANRFALEKSGEVKAGQWGHRVGTWRLHRGQGRLI